MSKNIPEKPLDGYSKIILDILLAQLNSHGGKLCLTKFTRSELKCFGLSSSDVKRSINLAHQRELIEINVQRDGTPVITLIKGSVPSD